MLFVHVSTAFALAPIGPTTASLKKGQFGASIDYSYGNMDLRAKGVSTLRQSWGHTRSVSKSIKLKSLNTHEVYGNLRFGITDKLNAFLRIGGANANWKGTSLHQFDNFFEVRSTPNWGDNSRPHFAIGFGTQSTLYDENNWKVGFLSQFSWTKSHYDSVVSTTTFVVDAGPMLPAFYWEPITKEMSGRLSLKEMQFALGISHKLRNQSLIYGGPFLHILDGDLNLSSSGFSSPYSSHVKNSFDIDKVVELGGYVGTQLILAKNTSVNIEYQHTPSADVLGLSLMFRK